MRVRLFLRTIIVLAFAGIFVAGALSVGKLFNYALPCGAAHGCDTVNNDPSSRWFNVPVAYYGFVGYLLILGLAVARSGMATQRAKTVALLGYLVSAFGALTSVALQIYSFTVIRATCYWCLTSAVLMLLLLFFHAMEYSDRTSEEVPKGTGEFILSSILAVLVAFMLVGFTANLKKSTTTVEIIKPVAGYPLVNKDSHIYGNPESPVTIIEFADLMCPHCQTDSPMVRDYVGTHSGKVRLVYRHFPLTMHPMSQLAAAVAEAAADEGKFWDFTKAIMATGQNMETPDKVWDVAKGIGLDEAKVKAKLSNDKGPELARLTNDISTGNALGINVTPTFIVQVQGRETKAFSYTALMDALQNGEYKSLTGGT